MNLYYSNFAGVLILRPRVVNLGGGGGGDAAAPPLAAPTTPRRAVDFLTALREAVREALFAVSRDF